MLMNVNLPATSARFQRPPGRTLGRWIVEVTVTSIGAALVVCAIAANQQWLDKHFLPSFLMPREWYVRLETLARVSMMAAGLLLLFVVRPRVARFATRTPARALQIAIAAVLALAASEPVLRHMRLQPNEWLFPDEEPRRRPDPRLGWTLVPARTGNATIGGRVVEYAIDRSGYRVQRVTEPVDPERPTILFTGESVMFGEGLTWEESLPAQVGAMMGVQSANLAVHGFASDQAYLRLQAELPRFRQPVAVVSLFMTALLGRNIDSERPHLGPGLVWLPAVRRWRLESLARRFVFYHSEDVIERGVTVTREVLRAGVELARARGASPLIIVPHYGHEDDVEQMLRRRILDGTDLPYLLIAIDPEWHLPWDRHPNARAAHAIAAAVAARLQQP
jgi:hypothetical protein